MKAYEGKNARDKMEGQNQGCRAMKDGEEDSFSVSCLDDWVLGNSVTSENGNRKI